MPKINPLPPEELSWRCGPERFSFATTNEVASLSEIIGQDRALRSIEFGLGITNHNYNIFVLGETGVGKETTVRDIVERKAKGEPVPDDWCYVFNFDDADAPTAINLPPGRGSEFAGDMDDLIDSLRRDIPKVFESKDYEKHRDEILEGQQERTRGLFFRLEQKAIEKGLILKKTVSGLAVVPAKNGKPMSQEEFEALPAARRSEIEQDLLVMQDKLSDAIREARAIEKETKDRINALDREVVQYVVNPAVNELLDKFKEFKGVIEYLYKVRENILDNIDDFRPKEEVPLAIGGIRLQKQEPTFERYKVNLIINNKDSEGAPVIFEPNPTYSNLFGRIEFRVQLGVATTDFTMIKAGSVHKANGGYLVVNAMDILRNIFVYDSLKRMIKNREARIEDPWEQYRIISSTTLKPSPIPVNIKLVIMGEPFIYYLLYNQDTEYRKIFKVKADFDTVMPRNDQSIEKYAHFVATRCREENLLPFDRTGVSRVIELGVRLAGDKDKLSARFNDISNIIVEASYWAGVEGSKIVSAAHVERADNERVYRNSKISEKLRDYIKEDTILITTEGRAVGQVNGLAILDPGDYAFGKPSRVTARVYMGDAGVVNIEREVKMSGRIHNKALMIFTSFLGERFARKFPLTLSATITFEQLYEEIEGDSATCTEIYALYSAVTGVPLDQGFAVTGSMNQAGEVQPIGGVNEKIEGFFDTCKAKGLTGVQGVIIPKRNVRNLMLKREVIDAVIDGKFAIYPIEHVDEGLEILTGMEVGLRDSSGSFPEGTLNYLVENRLSELARGLKEFGKPAVDARRLPSDGTDQAAKQGGGKGKE
ncbi:MAG: ATP-dependent protease [Deltaproteobacteria bacterium GWA2_54_12]|nr:MAG: ATP-dependent protease [Deltaproteobacteria bacterium GWA2_54_12]